MDYWSSNSCPRCGHMFSLPTKDQVTLAISECANLPIPVYRYKLGTTFKLRLQVSSARTLLGKITGTCAAGLQIGVVPAIDWQITKFTMYRATTGDTKPAHLPKYVLTQVGSNPPVNVGLTEEKLTEIITQSH